MSSLRITSRDAGMPGGGPAADRRIVDIGDPDAGPTLIITAALHGNEPSGIEGVLEVARSLGATSLNGRLIALVGHTRASGSGVRFIERDLNRSWTPSGVRTAMDAHDNGTADAEDLELVELKREIDDAIARAGSQRVVLLDLHTTSATSMPFIAVEDRVNSRRLARSLGVTAVFGIEALLSGLLISYALPNAHACGVFEAGQHDAPESPPRQAAAVRVTLAHLGMIPAEAAEDAKRLLRRACAGTPRMLEARDRHSIAPSDHFEMMPGFTNFLPISKGQPVASDVRGVVRASKNGRIFMPLYQSQGEDGFFLVKRVSPVFWYASTIARFLKARKLVRFFPGVRPVPDADAFLVDTALARFLRRRLFATLGYRRTARVHNIVVFAKNNADYDAGVALAESLAS